MSKKKKLDSTFLNMAVVLVVISLFSSAALSLVYQATQEKIAGSSGKKKLEAIGEVTVPGYDNNPGLEAFKIKTMEEDGELECFPSKKSRQITSVAIKTYTTKAYSGEMWFMVGFLPDGTINKVSVLDQKETPGLGTKVAEVSFIGQFFGKNPKDFKLSVKKDGGDVDAITAATITSRAACDAIERAYKAFMKNQGKL